MGERKTLRALVPFLENFAALQTAEDGPAQAHYNGALLCTRRVVCLYFYTVGSSGMVSVHRFRLLWKSKRVTQKALYMSNPVFSERPEVSH